MKGNQIDMDKNIDFIEADSIKKENYDTNVNKQVPIPVNTRCIGKPEGKHILYIEDYVYTYIKKILSMQYKVGILNPRLALFGNRYNKNEHIILVVYGAAVLDENDSQKYIQEYFNVDYFLGTAIPTINDEKGISLEIILDSTDFIDKQIRIAVDDFYVYYDQNQKMQNYLIEWSNKNNIKSDEKLIMIEEKNDSERSEVRPLNSERENDVARYGRVVMDYSKTEVRINRLVNLMKIIVLGFIISTTVYAITMINTFSKMQSMQEEIEYCYDVLINGSEQLKERAIQTGVIKSPESEPDCTEPSEVQEDSSESNTDVEDNENATSEINEIKRETKDFDNDAIIQTNESAMNPMMQQYYIVRKDDTLREISYAQYGNYEMVGEICVLNQIRDANTIYCGQVLILP